MNVPARAQTAKKTERAKIARRARGVMDNANLNKPNFQTASTLGACRAGLRRSSHLPAEKIRSLRDGDSRQIDLARTGKASKQLESARRVPAEPSCAQV